MKHALMRTLPGRAIVLGAAVKIAVFVIGLATAGPELLRVADTVASVALAIGGGYFLLRGLAIARRHLLWRVRRKLIISYIFIGFIPSLLIVAFFLIGGLFLFSNFSSYLVQNRFGSLTDRAGLIASATASEIQSAGGRGVEGILNRRRAALGNEFATISFAVVPMDQPCGEERPAIASAPGARGGQTAGPWTHVKPPAALPGWLKCRGFAGLFTYGTAAAGEAEGDAPVIQIEGGRSLNLASGGVGLIVRGVGVPDAPNPGYAVVVDIPMEEGLKRKLRGETGVDVTAIQPLSGEVLPLEPRSTGPAALDTAAATGLPLTSVTFLEQRDWRNGDRGAVMVSMRLNIGEIYTRISTQAFGGQRFSQGLLVGLIIIGGLFLIIQAVALLAGLALAQSITGSVHELFIGTERLRQRDYTHKIDIKARDQLGELAQSFNDMTASIEASVRDAAEKKRLEEELRIAHEIQMSLLPQGPLSIPGMSITAHCEPAREVGGDYYDVLPLDPHRVGVLIADVSGKGTYAALYMAELKGLMLSLSRIYSSPRELLIAANRIIAEHLDPRSFITMTYAVVDLRARTITYARAGHTPLIYLPGPAAANRDLRILAPDGLVLGLKIDNGEMFERLLQEETLPLHTGDLYLFFTDGISEAMNEAEDCFGETRLAGLVEEHAHLPADELRERLLREISAFTATAPRHDDMTMILLRIDAAAAAEPAIHAEPAVAAET